MASNVIDYFATLGRKSLICKSFESLWVNDKSRSPSEIWNEAITDIAIVHQGEMLPDDSWQVMNQSIDNRPILSRSTIAVRRRASSKRLDHITRIKLIKKGDVIPLGFELIDRSITKMFPAEIDNVGALAVKRAHASDEQYIQGEPLVDDICLVLVNEGEEVPEGYVSLERISAQKDGSRSAKSAQGLSRIVLAYHQRPAMGLCDLSYESATLDRYPQKDQCEFPLPVTELPMFAFPHDLRLSYSLTIRFPLPVFFSFVFTSSKGMHRYAACLRFYEIVPKEEIEKVFREVYGPDAQLVLPPSNAVFCPKIICVVSRMPFYRAMRRYLCQIFSMSLSSLPCPLEFFIASVVGQVPLPVAGGRPFHVVQDAALISSTSCAMNAIEFEVPLPRFFPPMDLDFAAPLRCLSVDRLLAVLSLMLRESKIVFLCCSNTLLTETMETLRSLLFPLKWSSCFVSRLPDALSGLLEAPGGFMIGLHMFEDKENDVEVSESHINKHFGDRKAVRQTQWTHSLTPGTFIVDLSSNAVFQYDGEREQIPLSVTAINNLIQTLPPGPRKRLQKKLQLIATTYSIGPQTVGLDRFDSAFDFQAYEDFQEPVAVSAHLWENFPTLEIRDYFMNFMADLLGNYQKYIIPPLEDMSADTYRTFKEEFSVEEYLNDSGVTVRPLLEMLVETQMFAVLLQQRSEASDYSLVFFESAGELMREYKLQAGGHNVKDLSGGTFTSSSSIPDMVAPLYKLLAAKAWAAANGKYHHTTDIDRESRDKEKDNNQFHNDNIENSPTSSKEKEINSDQIPIDSKKDDEKKYFPSLRNQTGKRVLTSSPPFSRRESKTTKLPTPLDYLVVALGEMEIEASRRSFRATTDNPGTRRRSTLGARNELDKRANLRLHDRSAGPLIIPGPSKALLNTTLPHGITTNLKKYSSSSYDITTPDDTVSVVTCSTDVSEEESVSLPVYMKAIAEFCVSNPQNQNQNQNHEETNHYMAIAALRTQNRSPYPEECNEIEYESDIERDSEGRFTYQIGWPVLHSKLLKLARRSVHTRLSGLRKSRIFALQMINRNIQLFLRAPTEQWACYRSIAYTNERCLLDMDSSSSVHGTKSSSPLGSSQNNFRNILVGNQGSASLAAESQHVISAVLEVLSVSLLLLCTRTLHEAKPVCDMLQVLGILAQADHMRILQRFDETIWRTLLVACASTGGDVMRKVACVIFDTLTACGITPDALTYGSYTRALSATKYSHQTNPCGEQMDQFLYLEEIGLAWFQQRSAVIEQSQADSMVPETKGANQKSGMLSTMFSRKKRPSVVQTRRRATRGSFLNEMTGASEAVTTTAAQLGLIRPTAVLSLLCPSGSFIQTPPRYTLSFPSTEAIEELSSELSGRIGKLVLDYKPPSPRNWNEKGPRSANNIDLKMFKLPDRVVNEESVVIESNGDVSGNIEAIMDLVGPGAVAISTDSADNLTKRIIEENDSKSSAYMSSALEAAVTSSSAAASTVKHYGNILIAGIPTTKRQVNSVNSVPVDVLQQIVRSGNSGNNSGMQSPLQLPVSVSEVDPPTSSPSSSGLGRMSRLTQSVFNPFTVKEKDKEVKKDKEKDEKEKEKAKDLLELLSISASSIAFSSSAPPTTSTSTYPQSEAFSSVVKTAASKMMPSFYNNSHNHKIEDIIAEREKRERKGSNISIRFSDDEADDSDEDGASRVSRGTSSTSIRTRDRDKDKVRRRNMSTTADPSVWTDSIGSVTENNIISVPRQNTMMSLKNFMMNMSPTAVEAEKIKENNEEKLPKIEKIIKESTQSSLFFETETKDNRESSELGSNFFQTPFSPSYDPGNTVESSPTLRIEPLSTSTLGKDYSIPNSDSTNQTPNGNSSYSKLEKMINSDDYEENDEDEDENFDEGSDKNIDKNVIKCEDHCSKVSEGVSIVVPKEANGTMILLLTDSDKPAVTAINSEIAPSTLIPIPEPAPVPSSAPTSASSPELELEVGLEVEVEVEQTLSLTVPTTITIPVPEITRVDLQDFLPVTTTTTFSASATATASILVPPIPMTSEEDTAPAVVMLNAPVSATASASATATVPTAPDPIISTPATSKKTPVEPLPLPTPPLTPSLQSSSKRLNVLAMQTDVQSTFTSAFVRDGSAIGIHCATPCPICSHTLLDEEVMAIWGGADHQGQAGGCGIRSISVSDELNNSSRHMSEKLSDTAPVSSITDMRGSDIEAAHCISCPVCTTKFSPQLHISCYELKSPVPIDPFSPMSSRLTSIAEWTPSPISNLLSPGSAIPPSPDPSPLGAQSGYIKKCSSKDENYGEKELKVVWRESVSHLSPKGLRLALEEQMEGIGERVADPCWLHVHRPAVYWNILWFATRLNVPTGFLASAPTVHPRVQTYAERGTDGNRCGRPPGHGHGNPGEYSSPPFMWHLPTIIGWREEVVRVKVRRCLSRPTSIRMRARSSSSTGSFTPEVSGTDSDDLQLIDLFPGCEDIPVGGPGSSIGVSVSGALFSPTAEGTARQMLMRSTSLSSSSSNSLPITRPLSSPYPRSLIRSRSGSASPSPVILSVATAGSGSGHAHSEKGSSQSSPSTPLSFKSIQPLLAPSMRLDKATEFLDGTAEGMRRAILEIGKYRLNMNENKNAVYMAGIAGACSPCPIDLKFENREAEFSHNKTNNNINDNNMNSISNNNKSNTESEMIHKIDKVIIIDDDHNKSPSTENGNNSEDEVTRSAHADDQYLKTISDTRKDPQTISRNIYIDLLTLFYMQKSKLMPEYGADSASRKYDLFKVVRDFLSLKDFELLGTSELDMLECVAGKSAQAYRIGLGFLF